MPKTQKSATAHKKQLTEAHQRAKLMFHESGQSVASWAREHGFHVSLVHEVLNGRNPRRGKSHNIAVLLGIKKGVLNEGGGQ